MKTEKKVSRGTSKKTPLQKTLQDVGDKIKAARGAAGMTYEALSAASGVSGLYISNLEKAKYENVSLEVLGKIARALKIELTISIK